MRSSEVCHHTDGRLDYRFESSHLAWLGNACLENGDVVLLVQEPNAKWYSYLGVVAAR